MTSKSEKLTARNRANSRKSTGPKTESGKKIASLNAVKHGLAGQTVVLPGEDLAAYEALRKRFFNETRPVGILEEQCVEMMANKSWLLSRSAAMQSNLFALGQLKYAHRTETDDPRIHAAMTDVHTLNENVSNLDKLSRYEHRHHKMYKDSLKQLRELQAERKEAERIALRRAAWAADESAENELQGKDFSPSGSESQPSPKPAAQVPDPTSHEPSPDTSLDPAPTQERLLPTGS
jgi:hypothetical protein